MFYYDFNFAVGKIDFAKKNPVKLRNFLPVKVSDNKVHQTISNVATPAFFGSWRFQL